MACTGFRHPLRCLLREAQSKQEAQAYLVPACTQAISKRTFSSSSHTQSRIGMTPISIPSDVDVRFFDLPKASALNRNVDAPAKAMEVSGPQGVLLYLQPH